MVEDSNRHTQRATRLNVASVTHHSVNVRLIRADVDRQRLQALLQRGIRSGLCSPETPNLTELAESVDDTIQTHHA